MVHEMKDRTTFLMTDCCQILRRSLPSLRPKLCIDAVLNRVGAMHAFLIDPLTLLTDFFAFATSLNSRLAVAAIGATLIMAVVIWRMRGRPGDFVAWMFPKAIYRNPSVFVDLKIFVGLRILGVFGFFSMLLFTPAVTYLILFTLTDLFGRANDVPAPTFWRILIASILMVLAADFVKYWYHRLHHENTVLWPFHSVHHSAEVLTPLTVARIHPIFLFARGPLTSLVVGALQALLLFVFIGKISILTIGGVNFIYVAFNLLGANFRHSHIWISYGPVWERILISPAQHQIHHSLAPEHHNKNYGEVFAIWDWMFGTLYVPQKVETLEFGLADEQGHRLEQPHPTFRAAMLGPFRDSWHALRKSLRPGAPQQLVSEPRDGRQ